VSNHVKTHRNWWKTQWSYKESIVVIAGIVFVGLLLQLTIGDFDYSIVRFPVNLFLLTGILLFVVLMASRHKNPFYKWLSGVQLSVSNIGGLLIYSLIMGIVPQVASDKDGSWDVGFDNVTRSWPFILVYLFTIINLSCVVSRRLLDFKWRDYAFYLNHAGLLVLLAVAGLGAADIQRHKMLVEEGSTECRFYDEDGAVSELPLSIKLNDFYMEEYMPKPGSLEMIPPEPKIFRSDIVVYSKGGKKIPYMLEVNKPLRVENWMIYQYGYDTNNGKDSKYSIFELVYDPWLIWAYIGICLFFVGLVCLLWQGSKNKVIGFALYAKWKYNRILSYSLVVASVFVIIKLLKPEIHSKNLMPALQSVWFIPHVTAYILSYLFLSAAAIAAVISLYRYHKSESSAKIVALTDNLVYVGFGLFMAGLLMGAVWAKEAWGHYWSWDPKETWSFATAATYLVYMHIRHHETKPGRFALWMIIFGFVLLMITWKGVSYLPAAQDSVHVYMQ